MTLTTARPVARPSRPDSAEEGLRAALRKISHLEIALNSSRVIGVAVGIIVERCKINPDEAFEVLVQISQHDHRKLRDVADELVVTGTIPTSL